MAARMWQIPSGVVTTVLIALCFQADEQGVYYLILTLTGLQALADAGLINTLLHAASHETAGARLDRSGFLHAPRRARQRLSAMVRFAAAWFGIAASILVVIGIVAGAVLLTRQQEMRSGMAPLVSAMILSGMVFALAPLVAFLEGCDQVRTVNRYRFVQTVLGSFVVWGCLASGAGLWTVAASIATQLACEATLIGWRYRCFFCQLIRTRPGQFRWREEIWPLQWRIGVQSMVRYLAFLPILPVLFDAHGPEIAGRYGMTWQVISSLMMVAYVYVRTRSPAFGRLIAEHRRGESNMIFKRVTIGSTVLLSALVTGFCVSLLLLQALGWPLTDQLVGRFLPITACVCFAIAVIPMHLTQCFSIFIRSQKFDPIWRVSLPSGIALAVLAYFSARSGHLEWIAGSMTLTFGCSAIALGMMCRWYSRHFQQVENSAKLG
ncbi:hypothetical protein Mal15_15280 [Stieleria maiorica]|uniref:Polysaccharide biosynthesis protein n=2 Tax=Stieleria maiorica TaxID=2795974 RepID=A0A5B9M8L4_9BACT|nr:hypothetical protein Mal15_15280 [Stieleria maiorica]